LDSSIPKKPRANWPNHRLARTLQKQRTTEPMITNRATTRLLKSLLCQKSDNTNGHLSDKKLKSMRHHRDQIKVLFVSHSPNMQGAEKSLLLLLKNIDRKYIEPIVVFPESGPLKEKISSLNIKTYKVRYPWWVLAKTDIASLVHRVTTEIKALSRLCQIIRQEKIDIVYTNTIVIFCGAIAASISRKPHIWHIREILNGNPALHSLIPHKALFKLILKLSQKVITNSNATKRQFQALDQHNKVQVVYNAIDLESSGNSSFFINIEAVKEEDWLVTTVGSIEENKAQDIAIHAVKIAAKTIPNIKLILIGDGDKEYLNYLKKIISELDVSANVIFTGYRDDIMRIISHCKVLLAPSLVESFGCTAVEAMAAGIPVIASNIGGLKEIIKDNVTGYLITPRAYLEIAEKLIDLYHHPDKARKMGQAGQKVAAKKFSIERYTQDMEKVIRDTVQVYC
jgi:glycosyltransferase involved in cell wall biosynthesis